MTSVDGRAADGRTIGKRGQATRRKLLDATAALLESHGVRDLRVVDITRSVGTSAATYYQYFRDVEAAVLVLADEVGMSEVMPLAVLLDEPWVGAEGLARAHELVERFIEMWDRNRAVLRTRNLAAQEGDARFREIRTRTNRPFIEGFAEQVRRGQEAGTVAAGITPLAAAAALVALIERMAAFHGDLRALGIDRDDVVQTTAAICFQTVGGRVEGTHAEAAGGTPAP
jgi:AcrR family transcriptional regulator